MKTFTTFLLLLLFSLSAYPQDITNTLGSNGVFSIKDNTTTFFSLYQDDGRISLADLQGSTLGFIYKNSSLFLHNYSPIGTDGRNTFLGINAGNTNMNGTGGESSSNTAVGYFSMHSLTTGLTNTAVGDNTLLLNTAGTGNTAIGSSALSSCTECYSNTAVGYRSLNSNLGGGNNTSVGFHSMYSNLNGTENTAMGLGALFANTDGSSNVAIGIMTMENGSSVGYGNTAVGPYSMRNHNKGNNNSAFGLNSLSINNTGSQNTAIGSDALTNNTSGNENVAVGSSAGTTIETGNNNICIGSGADATSNSVSNEITLGNGFISALRCNITTITSLSDARDKKNINDLSLGLDFISRLKPRQFNWDKREWYKQNESDGSKMGNKLTAGFIAQELDEVQQYYNAEWLNLVYKSNPDKLEATPGNLLPIMVKAIQELKQENEKLKEELQSLKDLKEQMNGLSELISELNIKSTANSEIVNTDTK